MHDLILDLVFPNPGKVQIPKSRDDRLRKGCDTCGLMLGLFYQKLRRELKNRSYSEMVPDLNFHDPRHTWKANARRSGMDEEIRKAIMGHDGYGSGTHEGYGWISDEELVAAVDNMTFDNGKTVIRVASEKNENPAAPPVGQFHETGAKRGQT